MKKRVVFFILVAILMALNASAQSKLYDKYSDKEGITIVYMTKAMISLIPNIQGVDIKSISNLNEVFIFSSKNRSVFEQLQAEEKALLVDSEYVEMMKVKDDDDRVNFYIKETSEGITELLICVESESEFTIIQLVGMINLEDISDLSSNTFRSQSVK